MEDYVRRLCACGIPDAFARSICVEFWREARKELLESFIAEQEAQRVALV